MENSNEIIIQNLERRFDALVQGGNSIDFFSIERDYVNYLEREEKLCSIIRSIIAGDETYKETIVHIIYILNAGEAGKEPFKIPKFLEGLKLSYLNSWDSIKEAESYRRRNVQAWAINETFGAGSKVRAHEIESDFKLRSKLSLIRRLHNDLLEKLSYDQSGGRENESETSEKKLGFVIKDGKLFYNDTEVVIKTIKNTNQAYLLKIILDNPNEVLEFEDVWEQLFGGKVEPKKWRKVYNAVYGLNGKITKQTQVSDFLLFTKTTIRINTKYLK